MYCKKDASGDRQLAEEHTTESRGNSTPRKFLQVIHTKQNNILVCKFVIGTQTGLSWSGNRQKNIFLIKQSPM